MPVQIQPVIGTVQQVQDYLGLTPTQVATNIQSGITLSAFITTLLGRTAWRITRFLNRDYTTAQVRELRFAGTNLDFIKTNFPCGAVTVFTSFDPSDPKNDTTVNIGAGNVSAKDTNDPYTLYRIDGQTFLIGLNYYIALVQLADPIYAAWPTEIVQTQLEMVATILKESGNLQGMLNVAEFESTTGRPLKYKDVEPQLLRRLRPYKQFPI